MPAILKPFTTDWDLNHMWGLEPSQNPAWDSNPAKTMAFWFQDLMKLRFLMSHRRNNSARDTVMGKKWTYSDTRREAHFTGGVCATVEVECGHPEIWRSLGEKL